METQVCNKCGCERPIEDFYWQDTRKAKRRLTCRFCDIERIMRNKKRDPDYQVKHQAKPVYAKRKPRVPNGQGDRSEYMKKYYQDQKVRLTEKNHADYIRRKLEIDVPARPLGKRKPIKVERSCTLCVNYPCFDGIENLESDFAKEGCHAFRKRETKQ